MCRLSVAYKNVVGARRASLRVIGSIESKENEKGGDKVRRRPPAASVSRGPATRSRGVPGSSRVKKPRLRCGVRSRQAPLVKAYRSKVEQELDTICQDILQLLDDALIPAAGDQVESIVFYQKVRSVAAPPPPVTPRTGASAAAPMAAPLR